MEVSVEELQKATSDDLIEYIAWKDEYPEEAKRAFEEFMLRFEQDVLKNSEIICCNWGYNEIIALDISKCVFNKVWKYPTYDHKKSKASNVEKGIKLWLYRIIFTQLVNYKSKGTCYEPDKDTDLSLIYSVQELIDISSPSEDGRRMLRKRLEVVEKALSQLTEKHRIIYLNYKLYVQENNKNIPRAISKKLQVELELTTGSIRKYKQEANKAIESYLNRING
ncbi:RNA polymerase subunit sigma [Lutimonas halocynthiae]|uniref:RNA polymerase subunit sigma n=1 Tax=Lutimonas halocynthiae TaxID=1446477 RepID=UPI0025B47A3A|nr:RNA polymerase subunit sigma [Lutimonas halocynthiae]MDN3643616.1 RNA polymerase subunit sigma [Lutimonas halocynthiae]